VILAIVADVLYASFAFNNNNMFHEKPNIPLTVPVIFTVRPDLDFAVRQFCWG